MGQDPLELDELAVSFLPDDDEPESRFDAEEDDGSDDFDSDDFDSDDFDSEPDDSLPDDSLPLPFAPDFDDRLSVL